jgi:hypothetical protein
MYDVGVAFQIPFETVSLPDLALLTFGWLVAMRLPVPMVVPVPRVVVPLA